MWNQPFPFTYIHAQQPIFYPIYYMPIVQGYVGQQEIYYHNQAIPQVISQEEKNTVVEVSKSPTDTFKAKKQENQQEENNSSIVVANKLKSKSKMSKFNMSLKSTNIQKNYAKAIAQYIIRQRVEILRQLGEKGGLEFLRILTQLKNSIKNINQIKKHLIDNDQLKLFRIIANRFLRKEAIGYVYNSNIKSTSDHVQQRNQIILNLQSY
ncbi:unnamed protein product (macronuclear) [Paramecium tetraurelia]|uniref:Uncharacterized protein n=1 Tax=Paramecium tetraurelia TaxID=5888 RepID=A0CN78_PARTE|nr:uncharacterized protein GSPATT00008686001 [Paramecium tetraurelia]CAK72245.1 unnamed protein product [Paramecium tetraurelia]|eukprot:XP_001439642.1 hypothetical protein (macronuclear) [Paramecium tetraurelia strain d4-2]